LGALPSDSTGWEFPAGATIDAALVSRLAEVLGVSGDLTVLGDEEGGGWRVGPNDGSEPSLTVAASAALDWYYSPAYATSGAAVSEPSVGGTELVDPVPADAGTASDGADVSVEVPVGDAPVDAPVDTVAPPENVPTQSEAETRATEMAEAIGLDPSSFTVTSYADEYSASVTFAGDAARGTAGRSFDVGFGENGSVQWASGQLATPVATGPFPLVDLDEALERLDEQYDWTDQPLPDDVILIDPVPADLGGDLTTDGAVEPGVEASGGDDVGAGSQGGAGTSDVAGAPAGGGDAPVVSPDAMPVDPMPIDPALGDPHAEPVDLVVTLTSVKAGLWWTMDVDGAVWLLPAYEFAGDDGATYLVPAVADDFLVEEPVAEPLPEPAPTDPVDSVPVDTVPVDTVPVEPVDPDSTESPAPPQTEPAFPDELLVAGLGLVGRTVEEATTVATDAGFELRVVEVDGEPLAVTADYRPNRINVTVTDDLVVAVASLG
jgi:hypothetical protein